MLKIDKLCKKMNNAFSLRDVTFEVPDGMIVGFVGANGAGKTTTLKCVINAVVPDSGNIEIFGLDAAEHEEAVKQRIGYAAGAFECFLQLRLGKIAASYSSFFKQWDKDIFDKLCATFGLDTSQRVRELSQGMKVKFALALALSHHAELYIFDEPTSGLDPIIRDEVLELFRDIVSDGKTSILFSTHITSDLDKVADRVVYIDNGAIVLDTPKDELLDSHVLVRGSRESLTAELEERAIAVKRNEFGFVALVERSKLPDVTSCTTEKPTVEDVMVFYNKELHSENAF